MGTKDNPGEFDCHAKALPNEETFTLLARDPSAPALVRLWAGIRHMEVDSGKRPESDRKMVDEAQECAERMELWRLANDGAWRKA